MTYLIIATRGQVAGGVEVVHQLLREHLGADGAQVATVHHLELLYFEHRGALADPTHIELVDQFVHGERGGLVVVRPPQQHQSVAHRLRQKTTGLQFLNRCRAVTLGQAFLVGTQNEGHVRVLGRRTAQRAHHQHLLRRVADVVLATDDAVDAHL